uniref:Uncharacterized protein n=1 Tax=Rhizophora mucronata TaxID=61149 RepID=A0A2P2J4C8_RHIMU
MVKFRTFFVDLLMPLILPYILLFSTFWVLYCVL